MVYVSRFVQYVSAWPCVLLVLLLPFSHWVFEGALTALAYLEIQVLRQACPLVLNILHLQHNDYFPLQGCCWTLYGRYILVSASPGLHEVVRCSVWPSILTVAPWCAPCSGFQILHCVLWDMGQSMFKFILMWMLQTAFKIGQDFKTPEDRVCVL